jgi:DNA uptake protein ComE-like DNA-binding protein
MARVSSAHNRFLMDTWNSREISGQFRYHFLYAHFNWMILEIYSSAIIFLIPMLAKLKRWIQSAIGLSSSEANAMMMLLPLLVVIIFSQPIYQRLSLSNDPIDIKEEMILDSLVMTIHSSEPIEPEYSLFEFDPNTATLADLKSLGIPEYVSKRIINYRSKGGQFKIKDDLARIYGLDSSIYKTLNPFILLPDRIEKHSPQIVKVEKIPVQFDLNLTDTTSLKTIKGIGTVLSKRIIKYRESLGGFVRTDQLKEVYGLDSLTLEGLGSFFIGEKFHPDKININSADEVTLSRHPYINSRDAKAIITYRLQHGRFQELSDLIMIKTLKQSFVDKIGPYLSFE